jgi:methylated-DNA-protein-cysteine methyltransferase-like protein
VNSARHTPDKSRRSERIRDTVARIPYGRVATYGQVAEAAGFPRAARMVGQALRSSPGDPALPWHRVINAQGSISFPPGSEPYRRQKSLLEAEGVVFVEGRVNLQRFRWQDSLDALLWDPAGWD